VRSLRKLHDVLLKIQFIKDEVAKRRVCVSYIDSGSIKANFLTKAVYYYWTINRLEMC